MVGSKDGRCSVILVSFLFSLCKFELIDFFT